MTNRTYVVEGREMTRFTIRIEAENESDAIEQAAEFYEEVHGNNRDHFVTEHNSIEEWEVRHD